MSVRIMPVQELAAIAYLTGAEIRDLYLAHVANVYEFNREYAGRHTAALVSRAEIASAVKPLRAHALTVEFIDDTLSAISLLSYNADEALAAEALTRIEACGFRTYRCIALHGYDGFRKQRQQFECES